jgi:hypothetical protein
VPTAPLEFTPSAHEYEYGVTVREVLFPPRAAVQSFFRSAQIHKIVSHPYLPQ